MARLVLFAAIREAAGCSETLVDATTIQGAIEIASQRFGSAFETLLPYCSVFVDGEPATHEQSITDVSEVALLPPVSGGAL